MTHRTLRAIQDASAKVLPASYFAALYDTSEEAEARFNIYRSRVMSANGDREEGG